MMNEEPPPRPAPEDSGGPVAVPDAGSIRAKKAGNASREEEEIGLLELLNILLRRWRLVIGLPILAGLLTTASSLLLTPVYTATTSVVPESRPTSRVPAALAGLAGQFGFSLGPEGSQSPRFYANVLTSRGIMDRVLRARYAAAGWSRNIADSATLLQVLRVRGDDPADSLHNGRKLLEDLVSVRVESQTNIITLSVDSRYPALAADVANRFIYYLNEFNSKTRQSQARERRSFAEQLVSEAERELRRAEDEIKTFYERNRSWQQSPQLTFEEGRLRRQVEIRQELYLTLKREYETARIEEVNDMPVITVIDAAVPPQEKSKPKRGLLIALGFVLGGVLGTFGAFAAEYLNRLQRDGGDDYDETRRLLARAGRYLRPGASRGGQS